MLTFFISSWQWVWIKQRRPVLLPQKRTRLNLRVKKISIQTRRLLLESALKQAVEHVAKGLFIYLIQFYYTQALENILFLLFFGFYANFYYSLGESSVMRANHTATTVSKLIVNVRVTNSVWISVTAWPLNSVALTLPNSLIVQSINSKAHANTIQIYLSLRRLSSPITPWLHSLSRCRTRKSCQIAVPLQTTLIILPSLLVP